MRVVDAARRRRRPTVSNRFTGGRRERTETERERERERGAGASRAHTPQNKTLAPTTTPQNTRVLYGEVPRRDREREREKERERERERERETRGE